MTWRNITKPQTFKIFSEVFVKCVLTLVTIFSINFVLQVRSFQFCSGKPKKILFKINHFVGIMPYYWLVWTYNRNLKTEKSPTMSSDWHQCPGCALKMRHALLVKATILKLSLSLLMNLDTIWAWNMMVGKIWTSAILMGTWWVRHWAVAKIRGQFAAKDTLRNFLRE